MKQYSVAALKEYIDFIVERVYRDDHSLQASQVYEDAISHREILNAKAYFEK